VLTRRFAWWAGADRIYRPGGPAAGLATSPAVFPVPAPRTHQPLTPLRTRLRAATAGRVLRLDLRPADLDRPRQVAAVERVLTRARGRVPVTLGEAGAAG
jgi:hypothetical protein